MTHQQTTGRRIMSEVVPIFEEETNTPPMSKEAEFIESCRDEARKQLPEVARLLQGKDSELIDFVQRTIDYYMENVCRLTRKFS